MKSKIKINRIMFPKNTTKTKAGDFCIFTATIVEHLEGKEPVVNPIYKTISLKGTVPPIKSGDEFIATYGDGETNNYGTTYTLKIITKEIDKNNKNQIKEYLTMLCGNKIAEELMKLDDPLGLIEQHNDEELLKVKGIGTSKLNSIYKGLSESADMSVAYSELLPLGLSKKLIQKICKTYGSPEIAIQVCKENPYDLIKKVNGISFAAADTIALKCGHDMNSVLRAESIVYNILQQQGSNGKSYLYYNQLIQLINESVDIDLQKVVEAIENMVHTDVVKLIDDGKEICLTYYFKLEQQISQQLKRLMISESNIKIPENWREIISELEDEQGWKHTDEQLNGIEQTLFNNVVVITGQAGTGKSTVTNAMCRILNDYKIDMTCLSAKAAQRIAEVTARDSSTIHRLLGIGNFKQKKNTFDKLLSDIIIVDEASMVNGELFLMLLKSLRDGTKLIILGDSGQLQAIGDCAVFSDMLMGNKIPKIHLTKIHRQAQKSAIITKARDIRNQMEIYPKGFEGHTVLGELRDMELFVQKEREGLQEVVVNEFFKKLEIYKNIMEVQIITAVKNRGDLCTTELNKRIQSIINKKQSEKSYTTKSDITILVGDKVIITKNNYKTKDINNEPYPVFNGNMGIVLDITDEIIQVKLDNNIVNLVNSERDSLNLAYAITVHSSQGSQWQSVIAAFDSSMWMLLNVEMMYTAITRASQHVSLIVEDKAVRQAIRTVEQKTKQTYLNRFLYYI